MTAQLLSSRLIFVVLLTLIVFPRISVLAQNSTSTSASSPPDPASIVAQSLAAAGAAGVQGFSGQGTTTYYWGSQPVQAATTVIAQGATQFRMDATLPSGTRTISVSQGTGTRKDANGTLTTIPLHNTLAAVVLTFPYLAMSEALTDPTAQISYIGTVSSSSNGASPGAGSGTQYDVRITHVLPASQDPQGIVAQLSPTDYFIDTTTLLVMKTTDAAHPIQSFLQSYPREVDFGNYTAISGVEVPTTVQQLISGNATWQFNLSTITWNPSLTASAFAVQ